MAELALVGGPIHHSTEKITLRGPAHELTPQSLLLETRPYSDCPDDSPLSNTSNTSVLSRPIYFATLFLRTTQITCVKKCPFSQLISKKRNTHCLLLNIPIDVEQSKTTRRDIQ